MFEECNCLIIYSWLCFSLRATFRINRTPQISANLYFTEREGLKKVLVNTQTELGVPSWKSKEFLVGVGFPPLLMSQFAILTDRICRHGQRWIEANADIFPVCWVWERAECKIEAVNLLVAQMWLQVLGSDQKKEIKATWFMHLTWLPSGHLLDEIFLEDGPLSNMLERLFWLDWECVSWRSWRSW